MDKSRSTPCELSRSPDQRSPVATGATAASWLTNFITFKPCGKTLLQLRGDILRYSA